MSKFISWSFLTILIIIIFLFIKSVENIYSFEIDNYYTLWVGFVLGIIFKNRLY